MPELHQLEKVKKKLNKLPLMLKTTRVLLLKSKHSQKKIRSSSRWRPGWKADNKKQALKIPSGTTLSFQSLRNQLRLQSPHSKRIRNGRAIIIPCWWNSSNKTKLLSDEMLFLWTLGARRHQRKQMRCQQIQRTQQQILPCEIVVTTG